MHATCASPPGGRTWPPVVARRCSRPSRLQALRASDAPVAEPQEPLSWHQSLARVAVAAVAAASLSLSSATAAPLPAPPAPALEAVQSSASLVSDAEVFDEAWRLVDENYLGARVPFDRAAWAKERAAFQARASPGRAATYSALQSSLRTLGDPYTRFVSPADFPALTRYDVSGAGLNLGDDSTSPTGLRVLGVVLDSRAARAGVQQGDALLEIDGVSVRGRSPFAASTAIAALPRDQPARLVIQSPEPGTQPRVALLQPAGAEPSGGAAAMEALLRSVGLRPGSAGVAVQMQSGGVGVLKLREFDGQTARQVAEGLASLRSQGATSLVLDLRDCPGGLVAAGVEVARLFLPEGSTVAYAAGRVQAAGGLAQADAARAQGGAVAAAAAADALSLRPILVTGGEAGGAEPLSVLVNGGTASAAEIVAGALRDNCRAPLVGARTFGKGLIQSVYELSDGSGLVVTVGTYVRPSGESLDRIGLSPDFADWPGAKGAQRALDSCVRPQPRKAS